MELGSGELSYHKPFASDIGITHKQCVSDDDSSGDHSLYTDQEMSLLTLLWLSPQRQRISPLVSQNRVEP